MIRAASAVVVGWAAALVATVAGMGGVGRAIAAPSAAPVVDDGAERVEVEVVGGALQPFAEQSIYVVTAEAGVAIQLSPRLALLATVPLALVERDAEVAAGWGNLGAGLRFRAVTDASGATWIRTLTGHLSAPTALDHDDPGLAARSAAGLHESLDLGDHLPGAFSARVTASVRWQRSRWWLAGALGYRFELFTYDRGETEYWQPLAVTVGVGCRATATWSVGLTVESTADLLEATAVDELHVRHLARMAVARELARWRAEVGVLVPLDGSSRDVQSPMLSLALGRRLGG